MPIWIESIDRALARLTALPRRDASIKLGVARTAGNPQCIQGSSVGGDHLTTFNGYQRPVVLSSISMVAISPFMNFLRSAALSG